VVLSAGIAAWLAHRALRPMREALALQRRFVSDAGHELRTPLTLLSTRVQLLARRMRGAGAGALLEVEADLRGVLDDTAALTAILEDLLAAAEPGRPESRVACDLSTLVAECLHSARARADELGIALQLQADERVEVRATPPALRRAVTALVDNALGHARTRVSVRVQGCRGGAEVVVEDDGPGLAPEEAARVFERFSSSRKNGSGGPRHYGLGLALVSEVAQAHGGSVTVDRADRGRGGKFVLRLATESPQSRLRRPPAPGPR
jgi:two-component system, OmpR family, sensor kinase